MMAEKFRFMRRLDMIAAYTQEEFLESLDRLHDERLITLKLVYTIPGYQDASLETKNSIYDLALNRVRSLKEEA